MFHTLLPDGGAQGRGRTGEEEHVQRNSVWLALLVFCHPSAGCTLGGATAILVDADRDPGEARPDAAADADAEPRCEPGANRDGDGMSDCEELGDGNPYTDPDIFNGLIATIGERPEWSGTCNDLGDYAQMAGRFEGSERVMRVYAGWEFDTDANRYDDPSYGFQPNWPDAQSGRFSVRYRGLLHLSEDGQHCFRIDIGATGTGIVSGKNACGQVYVDAGPGPGQATTRLIETGFEAASVDANEACLTLPAGAYPIDIVFWYFNVLERARLEVRYCAGGAGPCAPDTPLTPDVLHAP
jgi:hypothetical protein